MQFLGNEFIFRYIYHFDSLVFNDKGRQVSLSIYVFDSFWIIREGIKVASDHLSSLAPRARLLLVSNYLLYNFLFLNFFSGFLQYGGFFSCCKFIFVISDTFQKANTSWTNRLILIICLQSWPQ